MARAWSGQLLRRAKLGASGAWVPSHFVLVRGERPFRQHSQGRVFASGQGAKRVLHDAILERMERDHDQPRADLQTSRGRLEESIQPLELAIHPNAEGLE